MQVAVRDQKDTYRPNLHREEHVGKSTRKADKQATCLETLNCTSLSQTIESLLPDEEDLFSGVLGELRSTATADGDDEDFDLFSSSGGMELEGNTKLFRQRSSVTAEGRNNDQSSSDFLISREQPSRTLLVKNVDNRVNDSELRVLFEQHGDIQTFHTTCRRQGFVVVTYYDIKAATSALNTLQNKQLEHEKLHIQYLNPKDDTSGQHIDQARFEVFNCDSSISHDKLHQVFGNSAPQAVNSCMKDEYLYGVHSPSKMTINAFPIHAPIQANCCFTTSIPSPVQMASTYNQFSYGPHYSTDQEKLLNQYPTFHPQSLPSSCKGFVDNGFVTYGSLNSTSVGFTTEPNDNHLHMVGPYSSPVGHLFRGSARIGRSGFGGLQHAVGCTDSINNQHPSPLVWSHSPPFDNSVCAHSTPTLAVSRKSSARDAGTPPRLSFNKPRGRARRVNHGKHETHSCHPDEKKYELDIERVLRGEDCRTTLMIKNIPNKYSSATLLAAINEDNQGTYDFIYLPLDFKYKCNMGYAFINMIDPLQIVKFHKSFHGKRWEKFHSGKVACLAYARIQGKAALIAHFQESSLMNEDKSCHPILFTTDGPNAGNQEPFPLGPSIHSRRHKNRCNMYDVNENLDFLSASLE